MQTSSDSGFSSIRPIKVDELEQLIRGTIKEGAPEDGNARLIKAERAAIVSRRNRYKRYGVPAATDDNLMGLALSGGGIRSATFSLGVLQALAARDLLKHVDYLSTVSGGGFIGTSLLWWLSGLAGHTFGVRPYTKDADTVADKKNGDERFPYGTDDPRKWRDRAGQDVGPKLLRNLKEKGNYLTPGHGINYMSLLAVVLRVVVLNLLFWIPLLTVIFGLLIVSDVDDYYAARTAIVLAVALIAVALVYSFITGCGGLKKSIDYSWRRGIERWGGRIITLVLLAAIVASISMAHSRLVGGDGLPAGLVSMFGGLIAGLVTYFRTMRGVTETVRKVPGITTNLIAIMAAAFIIYGVLLFSYGLAVIVGDNGWWWPWGLPLAAFFFATSIWTNVNHISAHRMYRDRLMEAFMPDFEAAVKGRSDAAPRADWMEMHDIDLRNGPFPILNTNLLLIDSDERRRYLRGGDSFILTPYYCGSNATGWVDCRHLMEDPAMTLPTAMAISGAAANPNTGSGGVGLTRNRLISVLMAFIGLRLGYWLPNRLPVPRSWPAWLQWLNPDHNWPRWLRKLPNHVWPGLCTVLPFGHKETAWFLELSDGGHFENLGLYELVRRRVRLIILCDGAQDSKFAFEDLQRAQRRIAADFGATLDFQAADLERLIPNKTDHRFPQSDLKLADSGHIVGSITYRIGGREEKGTLIYLKTTLTDKLPVELLGYRGANPDFPDQSTGDQFFDEDQFEAYRELGYIIATRMMEDTRVQKRIEDVLGREAKWDVPSSARSRAGRKVAALAPAAE